MVNMAKKKITQDELNEAMSIYSTYFTEISNTYDELLQKSKKYLETTEQKIDSLAEMPMGTKGAQHYLSEHLENAASLISQCQSLNDSKYKIKKSILEYAIKDISGANDGNAEDYTAIIADLVKKEKEKAIKKEEQISHLLNETEIDEEIERILAENKNK